MTNNHSKNFPSYLKFDHRDDINIFINFDLLTDAVFKILVHELGFVIPGVLIYDDKKGGLRLVKYRIPSAVVALVSKVLKKEISETVFPLDEKENIMVRAYCSQKPFVDSSVKKMTVPHITSSLVNQIDRLLNVKMVVAFPIIVDGKSRGVFVFGSRTQSDISEMEREFLTNFSEQVGRYLQSAWLFKGAIDDIEILKGQKDKLQKLVNIKRDFLKEVSSLLLGLSDEFDLSEDAKNNITDCVKYLKSLFLLSTPFVEKEDKYSEDHDNK